MPAIEDETSPEPHSEPVVHPVEGDPAVGPARLDAFISYRRIPEDTAFVDRLEEDLAARGKHVWLDRAKIEPAADWSARVARGALGLAPAAPAGIEAAYQVSSGQLMTDLQAAAESPPASYSELPAQPWSPDGIHILAGNAIYACDSCGPLADLRASAAARIAWSQPLAEGSDHPPSTSPYG